MKYPTRPANISQVQPSSHLDEPFVVIWWDVETENRQLQRFKMLRAARRFRRKLDRIRKANLAARPA